MSYNVLLSSSICVFIIFGICHRREIDSTSKFFFINLDHFQKDSTSKMVAGAEGISDPILTRIAAEDNVKWFKRPNLRLMYLYLFLCCMGVEITSGFDSTLIGTLQISPAWKACKILQISSCSEAH